jgi:hypothetical protein
MAITRVPKTRRRLKCSTATGGSRTRCGSRVRGCSRARSRNYAARTRRGRRGVSGQSEMQMAALPQTKTGTKGRRGRSARRLRLHYGGAGEVEEVLEVLQGEDGVPYLPIEHTRHYKSIEGFVAETQTKKGRIIKIQADRGGGGGGDVTLRAHDKESYYVLVSYKSDEEQRALNARLHPPDVVVSVPSLPARLEALEKTALGGPQTGAVLDRIKSLEQAILKKTDVEQKRGVARVAALEAALNTAST